MTAAATEADDGLSTSPTLELVQSSQRQTGARHAERVTERNGSTVDVDPVSGYFERVHRHQRDGGESLTDFEEVDVGDICAGFGQGLVDSVCWLVKK